MIALLTFLAQNSDIIEDIAQAIAAGASKDAIRAAIRRTMIDVSDRAVQEELGKP